MILPVEHCHDDLWEMSSVSFNERPTAEPEPPVLRVEAIEGAEPLDAQLGVFPKKTAPDALYGAVFGQLGPTTTEIEAAGGDTVAVPPMQIYAILDAAKVENLPELLERSGLEHRCLFKGNAYDELKDVAPWLVQLEEGNNFTRGLFSRSSAPWHLWDREPGIYIRSRDKLPIIFAHLRKFFKLRDEADAWYYPRLHDPRVLRALLKWAPGFAQRFMVPYPQGNNLSIITCIRDRVEIAHATESARAEQRPIRIGRNEKAVFRHLTFVARAENVISKFEENGIVAIPTEPDARQGLIDRAASTLHRIYGYGFQQPLQQERWILWEMFYGAAFEKSDANLLGFCESRDLSSGDRFAQFQHRLEELYS